MIADMPALQRVLVRTSARMRARRGFTCAAWALCAAATISAVALRIAPHPQRVLLVLFGLALLAVAVALAWPLPRETVARAIDHAYALAGRVSAAVEFAQARVRTPFMEAALRDAETHAKGLSPRRIAPLELPRAAWATAVALALVGLSAAWPPGEQAGAARVTSVRAPAQRAPRALLSEDDLRAYERAAAALGAHGRLEAGSPLERYRALLHEIATGSIARDDALARALSLESALRAERAAAHADYALLQALTAELTRVRSAGRNAALPSAAGEQLRALAKALSRGELSRDERARLAEALARARERSERAEAKRSEDASLLKQERREDAGRAAAAEPSLLERRRKLESLRREHERTSALRRELSRLRRELDRAQSSLAAQAQQPEQSEQQQQQQQQAQQQRQRQQQQQAADALDRGGEAAEQLAANDRLERELAQLREQLQQRREAPGGTGAGEAGEPRQGEPPAAPDQGRDSPSTLAERRERFRLRAGGEEPGDAGARAVMMRRESGGAGEGADESAGSRASGSEGEPQLQLAEGVREGAALSLSAPHGSELGSGGGDEHDPSTQAPTARKPHDYQDERLAGAARAGPSRSQVIRGAAGGGFATRDYQRVYGDYRSHAEQLLERDDVPPGHRYFVQRYFQLVRPRTAEETP